MLEPTIIDSAVNKKFTEFSDAIKSELHSKLSRNDDIAAYAAEYDRINDLKLKFSAINGTPEE